VGRVRRNRGVAFDAAGNLYVLDRQASTVHVVAPQPEPVPDFDDADPDGRA